MPNPPSKPPNGKYNSTITTITGDLSSWSGSFTYFEGAIEYRRADNPNHPYNTDNSSQGNAIVFSITDGTDTIKFNGPSYTSAPHDKAQYSGHVHKQDPANTSDGWTATQT
jgi:hypothetical protein